MASEQSLRATKPLPTPELYPDLKVWASAFTQQMSVERLNLARQIIYLSHYDSTRLPSPTDPGGILYVSDLAIPAYSDGIAWRRFDNGEDVLKWSWLLRVTAAHTLTPNNTVIEADGDFDVTLMPLAEGLPKEYNIVNQGSTFNISVLPDGVETIMGAASVLLLPGDGVELTPGTTEWLVL